VHKRDSVQQDFLKTQKSVLRVQNKIPGFLCVCLLALSLGVDGWVVMGMREVVMGEREMGMVGVCVCAARHILAEKQGKIQEAYKKLQEGWLDSGDKVPPAEFAKLAAEYSECPSGKKGGDLGWFPRGKMAGPFQEVAFNTPVGTLSAPFKSTHGYHIILVEGRKN
jgi:NIMA-interacting peptidyl-prolyl cis-trans isomerase 4